jgi:hypothetical protein
MEVDMALEAIVATPVRVADEVWIAAALLHREQRERNEYTIAEIVARARTEAIAGEVRAGLRVQAQQHCVANRPPNPNRLRLLYATGRTTRRLYRPGDPFHPDRRDGRTAPNRTDIPVRYHYLLDWYEQEYASAKGPARRSILELVGLGKEIWKGVDPDEYVRELREGWE